MKKAATIYDVVDRIEFLRSRAQAQMEKGYKEVQLMMPVKFRLPGFPRCNLVADYGEGARHALFSVDCAEVIAWADKELSKLKGST